jgi:hypothetical protein
MEYITTKEIYKEYLIDKNSLLKWTTQNNISYEIMPDGQFKYNRNDIIKFYIQIIKWTDKILKGEEVQIEIANSNKNQIDIEAETIEMNNTLCINLNKPSLYLAYIGNGLVKVGYSSNVLNRENRHQSSSETEYPEFRLLKTFEISNSNIETTIHKLLDRFRVSYQKQKEIYKPPSTLTDFIQHIETLLEENDLQLQIEKYKMENMKLKEEIVEKNKKLVELKRNY